jgi:hypothetical protein
MKIPKLSGIPSFVVLGVFLLAIYLSLRPAIQGARGAADRKRCMFNLRSFGLTFKSYNESRGHPPTVALMDAAGKPLLSWRVLILPWLTAEHEDGHVRNVGFDELYKSFRLNEPWDSPHNKALIKYMPAMYLCPASGRTREAGLTNYRLVCGPGTLYESLGGANLKELENSDPWSRSKLPSMFAIAKDGSSNTLLVTESTEEITWTKPDELEFGPGMTLPSLGSKHQGSFNLVFVDGTVRQIKVPAPPDYLRAIITANGKEKVR